MTKSRKNNAPDFSSPGTYRGRFAPSPTGNLHFGSLVAALGSFLQAKSHNGTWLVRIDNLDRIREVEGSTTAILKTLESFALCWDEEVLYQDQRTTAYQHAMDILADKHLLYRCNCSRKQISEIARHGVEGYIYPGTCREKSIQQPGCAIRIKVPEKQVVFTDLVYGLQQQQLAQEIGDFVIKRADGFFAYHLAAVVDDAMQGITEIVRGADLLFSTPRQIFLQQTLGLPTPRYAHLPVVLDKDGKKLSKESSAHPVDNMHPLECLTDAWNFLQTENANPHDFDSNEDFLAWAIKNWSLSGVQIR